MVTRFQRKDLPDAKKKSLFLRERVRFLCQQVGWSQRAVAEREGVSREFVARWAGAEVGELTHDGRGWPAGRARQWSCDVKERVRKLHARLTSDPRAFFTGATAVQRAYAQRFPRSPLPPVRTIGRMLHDLGLSSGRRRGHLRGAAAYLGYPYKMLEALGGRLSESDFIGPKYLTGSGTPLHFVGFSLPRPPRGRYFYRVEGQTADQLIEVSEDFLTRIEHPSHIKLDNGSAAIGSGSAPCTVSRYVLWLLAHEIEPIFAVPRRPFSQASIEGNNSVFARKFWNARQFTSARDVDRQLRWFNEASLAYTGYTRPSPSPVRNPFRPRVHFIRQIQTTEKQSQAGINILNTWIPLPSSHAQLFVLATWELETERLNVRMEKEGRPHLLSTVPLPVNHSSPYKSGGLLSFGQ